MRKPTLTIFDLVNIVNEATSQTSDVVIAKAFIENREHLDDFSMDYLSDKYFVSQASISRFIKKLGYKNYGQFKRDLIISLHDIAAIHPVEKIYSIPEIISTTKNDIESTLSFFDMIQIKDLQSMIQYFLQFKNIYFFGSKLSVSIVHLLQQYLLMEGKNVYTLYEFSNQKETLKHLTNDDLVIFISLEGRWLRSIEKNIKETKCAKILWAPKQSEYTKNDYQNVYYLSESSNHNLGYHYLMYYVLLLYKLLLTHSLSE